MFNAILANALFVESTAAKSWRADRFTKNNYNDTNTSEPPHGEAPEQPLF
jgi:hypothetical protein